jgi:hypothetical protein
MRGRFDMNKKNEKKIGQKIPLAEMVQKLRQELVLAQVQAKDEKIHFELEKVELELQVVVSSTGKGHAGVEFWVVNASGEYEKKGETTHTIKLTLNARENQSGKKVELSGETTKKISRS